MFNYSLQSVNRTIQTTPQESSQDIFDDPEAGEESSFNFSHNCLAKIAIFTEQFGISCETKVTLFINASRIAHLRARFGS